MQQTSGVTGGSQIAAELIWLSISSLPTCARRHGSTSLALKPAHRVLAAELGEDDAGSQHLLLAGGG